MSTSAVFDVQATADGAVVAFMTERLTAHRLTIGHRDWLRELHQDGEVMAQLGGVRISVESDEWLAANLDHWARFGFGQWVFSDPAAATPIGRGGLRMIDSSVGEDLVEIGYTFARSAWGCGFATEASRAFVDLAFGHYDLSQLGAITLETNVGSQHVLDKVGFVYERDVEHSAGRHRFYRLIKS
jgi:[ribosomal protein S5]-alanine N-acetyltransferase